MKVIEHIEKATSPLFSYEIIPPSRGKSLKAIIDIVEKLVPFHPPFIDVTSHASSVLYKELPDGSIQKKIYKKRPGTIGICGIIQNRFHIDAVAHILCQGFTKEETEDALLELSYLGVHNVLALRGDELTYQKKIDKNRSFNHYASDLVEQIHHLNQGKFLDPDLESDLSDPIHFCMGVAGYPEKHFEAPNQQQDLQQLQNKIKNGADYICTQMFYDNQVFKHFQYDCHALGIQVPIIPGLKVLTSEKQINTLVKNFHISLPDTLVGEVRENPQHAKEIGIRWAIKQSEDLLNSGVKCIHFYVMNDPETAIKIVKALQ